MDEIALLVAFLAVVLAIVAIHTASTAQTALRHVQRRLRELLGERDETPADVAEQLARRRREEGPPAPSGPSAPPAEERATAPEREAEVPPAPRRGRVAPPAPTTAPSEPEAPERAPAVAPREPAAPKSSLEERLGASLPIWFGAVALTLAGIFLVKHFVERGLLGPGARVGLAVAFGVALLILAVRVRRKRPAIAQGLAAAGVAVLSGAVYAATALYGFLTPLLGVVAQGVVTALAVVASLRFGPFVALLGLVGGFVIPALIGPGSIEAGAMFGYLMLLQVALALLGRRQGWWWVPLLGALGAFVWAFAWQALRMDGASVISAFAFSSALVALYASRGVRVPIGEGLPEVAVVVPWLVTGAAIAVVMLDMSKTAFAAEHWGWTGALAIGTVVLAGRDRAMGGLPWLVATVIGTRLLWVQDPDLWTEEGSIVPVHAWAIVGYGLVFGVGTHLAAGGRNAWRSMLAWLPPGAAFVALRAAHLAQLPTVLPGVLAAVVAGVLAVHLRARGAAEARTERESGLWTAALLALGCAAFDGVGEDYRAAVLAVIPVVAAVLHWRLLLPQLALVTLALSAGSVVVLGADHVREVIREVTLFWNPPSIGTSAVTAALLACSRILHRASPGSPIARVHQTTFVGLAAVLLLLWNLQIAEKADIPRSDFLFTSTLTIAWLTLGQALFRSAPRWAIPGREWPGSHLTLVGLCVLVLGCGMVANPLGSAQSVGEVPIFNAVLLAFGGGGALALLAARSWADVGATRRSWLAAAVAFACGFALVSLWVRQAFQGDILFGTAPDRAEWYSYSAAWLAYGAALLAVGVVRGFPPLRYASLLVVLAAVLKVFLFDASNLDGLWRVLSFFGLGVALIALAWVYQRYVVAREPT